MNLKLLFLYISLIIVIGLSAAFEGGSGTAGDPYQISTCQELQNMENNLSADYELVNEIDCKEFEFKRIGYGASSSTRFNGDFNGKNHIITNLNVTGDQNEDDVALFGGLGSGSKVENLMVLNASSEGGDVSTAILVAENYGVVNNTYVTGSVNGDSGAGGLVDYNKGDIYNSYSGGKVSGGDEVGGLVGRNSGKIYDSYSTSRVSGNSDVGGLVGYNGGTSFESSIFRSFSTGEVSGNSYIGGLVGDRSYEVYASNSYWDINSSDQSSSNGGTDLTTSEMTGSAASSKMAGFDFQDTWSTQSFYYPRLQWMELGSGTEADPFMIYNCGELQALNNSRDDHYQLANDIECSDTVTWESGKGFYPIARDAGFSDGFGGSLDGANRKISGLYINRSTNSRVGMFGKIYSGNVREVKIDSFNISGSIRTGTLSAAVDGSSVITNISVRNSEVNAVEEGTGTSSVGGVIGDLVGGSAENMNVYNSVIYGGQSGVGGVVGVNEGSTHNLSSFSNDVDGRAAVGAVFGDVEGLATNSYADNASIVGEFDIGGISGGAGSFSNAELSNATIENSEIILTSSDSGGVVGGVGSDAAISDVRSLNNTIDSQCGSSCTDVGGIVGELLGGTVKNSYSAGNEFLGSYSFTRIGILAGRLSSSAELNDSYWDDDKATVSGAIGQNSGSSSNLIGLTSSEMQGCNSVQNMNLFDFENFWIAQSNDYPALRFFASTGLSCDLSSPPLAPTLLLPLDGSSQVPVTTNLSVTAEGTGLQNITFYQNNSGADSVIGSALNVNASNSEVAQLEWSGLNTSSLYEWYAVAENSAGSVNSSNWNFTTEQRPVIDGFEPAHGSNTEPNPELKVNVSDDISNDIEVRFYDSSDQLLETVSGLSSGGQAVYDPTIDTFASNPGQTYEWYAVVETDSGASINSSGSPSFASYWNFTTQNLISASIDVKFGDQVNMNNGSADIGSTDLRFEPWNPSNAVMDNVIVNVDGSMAQNFSSVSSNSTQKVDISSLGLSEDQTYSWSISVEDSGVEVGSFNGEFTTHTVDIQAVPQDDSHDSINIYYSEDGVDFSELKSFSRSDNSPLSIKAANSELYQSNSHCYTAAASRLGIESAQSPEVCVGGDIP